jgi:hypothetical protein
MLLFLSHGDALFISLLLFLSLGDALFVSLLLLFLSLATIVDEVLHVPHQVACALGVEGMEGSVGALACDEEAELVQQLGPTVGVEVGDAVGGRLLEERVMDLSGHHEVGLLHAGDVGGLHQFWMV